MGHKCHIEVTRRGKVGSIRMIAEICLPCLCNLLVMSSSLDVWVPGGIAEDWEPYQARQYCLEVVWKIFFASLCKHIWHATLWRTLIACITLFSVPLCFCLSWSRTVSFIHGAHSWFKHLIGETTLLQTCLPSLARVVRATNRPRTTSQISGSRAWPKPRQANRRDRKCECLMFFFSVAGRAICRVARCDSSSKTMGTREIAYPSCSKPLGRPRAPSCQRRWKMSLGGKDMRRCIRQTLLSSSESRRCPVGIGIFLVWCESCVAFASKPSNT